MHGIFTISLDFELHWGVFDKKDRAAQKACYENTLRLVPEMLEMFSRYDVHVTWATVGSLFADHAAEWSLLKPGKEPQYENEVYSAYAYARAQGLEPNVNWAHFAPSHVQMIRNYPGQELGTHTFSHFYCLEPTQSPEAFSEDLDAANKASAKFNNQLVSLVFPRNQFEPGFLRICYQKGIRAVRSNPKDWFWTPVADSASGLARKIFRTADAYIPVGRRTSYPLASIKVVNDEPLQLPASRFLRPWSPRLKAANGLQLKRIKSEMSSAASRNECFHLWWHPENFGYFPEENMKQLKTLLDHYILLQDRYGMKSWNMGEYVTALANPN